MRIDPVQCGTAAVGDPGPDCDSFSRINTDSALDFTSLWFNFIICCCYTCTTLYKMPSRGIPAPQPCLALLSPAPNSLRAQAGTPLAGTPLVGTPLAGTPSKPPEPFPVHPQRWETNPGPGRRALGVPHIPAHTGRIFHLFLHKAKGSRGSWGAQVALGVLQDCHNLWVWFWESLCSHTGCRFPVFHTS